MSSFVYYSKSLKHDGIMGMKWGVRRYRNKDGTLTPAGKKDTDMIIRPVEEKCDVCPIKSFLIGLVG